MASDSDSKRSEAAALEAPARKPYRRPEITFHERLEVFATVCTPGKADVITCPNGPIAS